MLSYIARTECVPDINTAPQLYLRKQHAILATAVLFLCKKKGNLRRSVKVLHNYEGIVRHSGSILQEVHICELCSIIIKITPVYIKIYNI